MSVADVVLSVVMLGLMALAARSIWRRSKRGGCGCGGCAGCAGCARGAQGCAGCAHAARRDDAGKLTGDKRGGI